VCWLDILSAIAYVVKVQCFFHIIFAKAPVWCGLLTQTLSNTVTHYRYTMLAVGCAERYVAVCHPFQYKGNAFTRHLKLWSCLLVLPILGLFAMREILSRNRVCIHPVVGMITSSLLNDIVFISIILVPSFIASGLLLLIFKELRNMKNRRQAQIDEGLESASRYICVIFVAFMVCLIPVAGSFFTKMFSRRPTEYTALFVTLFNSLYGIVNTLVYGWMHKNYRAILFDLLRCRKE